MTGPSPWRLPSPRGGMTSVTVSGSTIEPVGSIILLPGPEVQYYVDRRRQAGASHRTVTQNRGVCHEPDAHRGAGAAGDVGGVDIRSARGQRAGAALVR